MDNYDYLFKIVVIGDVGVGKSSIIRRWNKGYCPINTAGTVGVDFCVKTLNIDEEAISLHCWDTAGQERFKALTQSYYRNADAVIVVYDLSDKNTFANVPQWLVEVNKYTNKNVLKVLVGNKKDLAKTSRQVELRSAKNLAEFEEMIFMETSAKEAHKIDELFVEIAKQLRDDVENNNNHFLSYNNISQQRNTSYSALKSRTVASTLSNAPAILLGHHQHLRNMACCRI